MSGDCSAKLVEIVKVRNTLGEGVSWDAIGERLWWTDIQERCLYRYDPRASSLKRYEVPERLCSFGFVADSERLIAAFESGLALYHPDSKHLEWIARPGHDAANVRFNDGRVDRHGRFWTGSMSEGTAERKGKLYCLNRSRLEVHLDNIAISNSICFSPDGKYLYFADTPQRLIQRYDIDAGGGAVSSPQPFVRTPEGAFPDGSTVDASGHVWNAHWNAGRVVRYAPDGSISGEIDIPASQPTCVAFGGRELDLLFVTSARQGLSATSLQREPCAGDVFVYELDVTGLPDSRYVPPRPRL